MPVQVAPSLGDTRRMRWLKMLTQVQAWPGSNPANNPKQNDTTRRIMVKLLTALNALSNSTTISLTGAGTTGVNQHYTFQDANTWTGTGYTIIYIAGDGLWEIYDAFAVVYYACTPANFPVGPWTKQSGANPVPTGAYI